MPAETLSESEFLQQQAAAAKAAIGQAVSELGSRIGQGVDPRLWAKEYPWMTVGAATVAGFVAATMLVPSKQEQALKRLAAIERALNPPPPPPPKSESADGDGETSYKRGQHSFLTSIAGEVIGAIKPAVISLLTAGVTAKTAKPSHEEMKAAAAAGDQGQ